MNEEEKKYREEVSKLIRGVGSREELVELTELLAHGFERGFEEEQSVTDYLDGYAALVEALDSWYKNQDLELPEHPTWNMMGRLLASAFIHS
ncbi:MAG: hypothetical protein GKS00_25605 [Alphaproteobacteria bacterium]|nr:hypothetical protein [Alphaproteobacteria bacterium]